MAKFIITAEDKKVSAFRGAIMAEPKRGLYYDPGVGRNRVFRMSLNVKPKKMRLLTYTSEKNAQKVCDYINETFNDNFKVVALEPVKLINPEELDFAMKFIQSRAISTEKVKGDIRIKMQVKVLSLTDVMHVLSLVRTNEFRPWIEEMNAKLGESFGVLNKGNGN